MVLDTSIQRSLSLAVNAKSALMLLSMASVVISTTEKETV